MFKLQILAAHFFPLCFKYYFGRVMIIQSKSNIHFNVFLVDSIETPLVMIIELGLPFTRLGMTF